MKRILFVILSIVTFFANAQMQKIDYKNKKLEEVFIDLEKRFDIHFSYNNTLLANKKFSFKDKTDLDMILLEISLQHNLKIEYIDISNIIVTQFNKNEEKSFNDNKFLDEVVIKSEYLTFGFDKNKGQGTLSLQPNKLGVLPGLVEPDVMQTLQMLPGISSPDESASKLHIRGGTPDQNSVLFDGIKMYHQGHLFGMISPFNPYITDKVNIYRSGTSAEYGDRISGVIDMKTQSNIPEQLKVGIGSNFINADAFIKTPLLKKKIGAIVSFRRSLTDVFNSPTYKSFGNKVFQNTTIQNTNSTITEEEQNIIENSLSFTDATAKLIIKPNETNTINISGITISNNLKHATADDELDGLRDNLKVKNYGVSIQWNSVFSDKLSTFLNGYTSTYDTDYLYNEFEENIVENSFLKDNDIKDIGLQAVGNYKFTNNQEIKVGYNFSNLNVNYNIVKTGEDPYTETKKSALQTHALFSEYLFKTDKLYARAGIRANYFNELEKFTVEPRLYANYSINDNLSIKASAEIKNQAISQLVSFTFNHLGLDNTIWAVADKGDIPILNNKQFTAGILYAKKGWKLDIETYYKNISGLSSFTKGFNITNNTSSYISGKSYIYGLDLLVKKRIKNFRTWLSYSLSKNDFSFPKITKKTFAGNYDQRHVFSLSNTYKYNDFQFSLGWQYSTGKPYTKATLKQVNIDAEDVSASTNLLNYGVINKQRINDYHRLDISAVYDFYLDDNEKFKARLGASLMNTYSKMNVVDKKFKAEYNNNTEVYELSELTTVGVNITPNLVFRVNF